MNKIKVTSLLLALFFVVVAGLAPAATTEGAKSSENAESIIVGEGSTLSIPPSYGEDGNKSKDDNLKREGKKEIPEPPKEEKEEPKEKHEKNSGDNPVVITKDSVKATDGGDDPTPHINDPVKEKNGGFIIPAVIGAFALLVIISFAVLWTKYKRLEGKYKDLEDKREVKHNNVTTNKSNKNYGKNRSSRDEKPLDDSGESVLEQKDSAKIETLYNYGVKKNTGNINGSSQEEYIERDDLMTKKDKGFDEKTPKAPPLPEVKSEPQPPKKGIAEKFNDMMAEAAAAPGLMGKSIREKFVRDYKVTPYKCVNFAERLNNSDIPPRFEVCGLGDSTLWGIPISGDKMAILPSLPAYEETAHYRGGMKELFESNYKTGSFRKIEVVQVAVASKDFSQISKGELSLS